jgi:hypothetical protein
MVAAQACHPSTQEAEAGEWKEFKFEASLEYIEKPFKKKKPGNGGL